MPDPFAMPVSARSASSYAVFWNQQGTETAIGKLVLEPDAVVLSGASRDGRLASRTLPYTEIAGVRIGRAREERLNGDPTLIVERHGKAPVRIAAYGPGLLHELANLLARLSSEQAPLERVVVVAPLRKQAVEKARSLIEQGPPFDLAQAGLERHEVFLTEEAVIFVFEGHCVKEAVQQLARDPGLWRAAASWSTCLAGRPQLAQAQYSWRSPRTRPNPARAEPAH
jgi:hypothetical protein